MAAKANITIEQGTDVEIDVNIANEDDFDLSGYSCRSQMRKHHLSATAVTFGCAIADSNTIVLSLTNQASANIEPGRYVYDVEIVSPVGTVTRVVEGIVYVTPEVTKL